MLLDQDLDRAAFELAVDTDTLKASGTALLLGAPVRLAIDLDFRRGPATQVVERATLSGRLDAQQIAILGFDATRALDGPVALEARSEKRRNGQGQVVLRGRPARRLAGDGGAELGQAARHRRHRRCRPCGMQGEALVGGRDLPGRGAGAVAARPRRLRPASKLDRVEITESLFGGSRFTGEVRPPERRQCRLVHRPARPAAGPAAGARPARPCRGRRRPRPGAAGRQRRGRPAAAARPPLRPGDDGGGPQPARRAGPRPHRCPRRAAGGAGHRPHRRPRPRHRAAGARCPGGARPARALRIHPHAARRPAPAAADRRGWRRAAACAGPGECHPRRPADRHRQLCRAAHRRAADRHRGDGSVHPLGRPGGGQAAAGDDGLWACSRRRRAAPG